jgi:UPF0597 protein RUMGNA_00647
VILVGGAMDKKIYDTYIELLRKELVPALGCTEPIAIALATARARAELGNFPEEMTVLCSGNIIKNAQSVKVPNSGGLKGISAAAVLGCVGGRWENGLEVLNEISGEEIEQTKSLLKTSFCHCSLKEGMPNLYIQVIVKNEGHQVSVTIEDYHTNITKIEKDGKIIFHKEQSAQTRTDGKERLNLKDIVEFAQSVRLDDVKDILKRQIEYNSAISEEGLIHEWGCQVGRTLLDTYGNEEVEVRAKARAAAGSDARMSGCALPVVINSGSGNQGMTASLPVIEYAKTMNIKEETLYRALCISNLLAQEQKKWIGSLSAYCGAVCAAAGAGAAITYLCGGTLEQIGATVTNTICNIGGMICDGAKPSCAAKIASAVDAAIMAHNMSMKKRNFVSGEGLMQKSAETTIQAVGYVGRIGMKQTDVEILNVMLGNQRKKNPS